MYSKPCAFMQSATRFSTRAASWSCLDCSCCCCCTWGALDCAGAAWFSAAHPASTITLSSGTAARMEDPFSCAMRYGHPAGKVDKRACQPFARLARRNRSWRLMAAGDQQFVEFVNASSARLLHAAYLLTGDRHQAEDAVQTALAKTYAAWSRVRHDDAYAYTRKVLTNHVIDAWRRPIRE